MQERSFSLATVASVLLLLGCTTPTAPGVDAKQAAKEAAPAAIPRLAILRGPPHSCASFPCTVPVTMLAGSIGGKPSCLAQLPDPVNLPRPAGGEKTIVWELNTSSLPGVVLYFQTNVGIVVLDDKKVQIRECKSGNGSSVSTTQFHCKHKHNQAGAVTVYLPIVMQTEISTGEVSMCGAADPRIVNAD
jgi:hypothetical protein